MFMETENKAAPLKVVYSNDGKVAQDIAHIRIK